MLTQGSQIKIKSRIDGVPRAYTVGTVDAYFTVLYGPDGVASERYTRHVLDMLHSGKIIKL